MVVDLLELERMASEREGYPGLHFEYTLSEVGGAGWIYLTPGKTLPLKATDLPDVMKNIMKFAADRLKMPDLPPGRPSFITRVLGFDSGRFQVWQARRARCPQVAQASGALLPGSRCPARNAA